MEKKTVHSDERQKQRCWRDLLQGDPNDDTGQPDSLSTLWGCCTNLYATQEFFCFILLLAPPGSATLVRWCLEPSQPQGSAMMGRSLPMMSRKRLVCDAADASVTHACLVQRHHRHRLPRTNHGPVSSTFKHWFVTKFIVIWGENCGASPFF